MHVAIIALFLRYLKNGNILVLSVF